MKKAVIFLLVGFVSLFSVSCKNEPASKEAKQQETTQSEDKKNNEIQQQTEARESLIQKTQAEIAQNGKFAEIINRQDIDINQYQFSEPRAKAVEVIRAKFMDENSYTIRAFFKHDGKTKEHRSNFRFADDYSNVRYLWVNDDEVLVSLVSADNSKQTTFTISHNQGETSIKATHY